MGRRVGWVELRENHQQFDVGGVSDADTDPFLEDFFGVRDASHIFSYSSAFHHQAPAAPLALGTLRLNSANWPA